MRPTEGGRSAWQDRGGQRDDGGLEDLSKDDENGYGEEILGGRCESSAFGGETLGESGEIW